MDQPSLYPLRFEPIYQYRLWGGHNLAKLLDAPLIDDGPIGEAWILSDRDDHESVVADGLLQGQTIGQLIKRAPEQMFGKLSGRFDRFPLLLKFLDAKEMLSVQVHPSDLQTKYLPAGESGKTEAWVVLEAGPKARADVGLTPGTTREILQKTVARETVADHLAGFTPKHGDGIFLPAGTVHSFGDAVVFEVEENSDVTFRLYDWDRVDPKTGKPRPLQIDQAIACVDLAQGVTGPVVPIIEETEPVLREKLFFCKQFGVWRKSGSVAFTVGAAETPRMLVCLEGEGQVEYDGVDYALNKGDTLLLPAVVGACRYRPHGTVTLLEISLPESAPTITT